MDIKGFYRDHKVVINVCAIAGGVAIVSLGGGVVLGAALGPVKLLAAGAKLKALTTTASTCGSQAISYCAPKLAHGTLHGAGAYIGHAILAARFGPKKEASFAVVAAQATTVA